MHSALEFYYDFISPNAYLAWHNIRNIAEQHQRDLVLRPVLFAALLQAHGQAGPAEVPPKRDWMVRNCLRKAAGLGIELHAPHSHPFNPLAALRLTLAAPPPRREELTELLFRAAWAQCRDISSREVLAQLLEESGYDTALIESAAADSAKQELRDVTAAAIERGVFGVPSVIVDNELFFGFDDLPWLERFLRGEDRLDEKEYARWRDVRPSARRRRR